MADNVNYTNPATGLSIAADDATVNGTAGTSLVQRMKLTIGADGTANDIAGDTANGIDVDVTRSVLPTGASTEATLANVSKDGTDITSPTAMPSGGVGIRGWLSAIWTKLNGSLAVTGTFYQSTQPVSIATNTPDVTDRAARLLGHVTVDNSSLPVTGTFYQATQPVSGTVAISNPTTNPETGLAKDATLTGGTQKTIARGGAKGTTAAADVTSIAVDANTQALHTNVTNFPATQPVSGTFFQATQPISGTVTSNQGTANATPWNENISQIAGASPSATNALPARISNGAAFVDPTQIRALTNADIVKSQLQDNAGTAILVSGKGTQTTNALPTQDLKDAGRNHVHFYTLIPVLATATDVLQTLTGTKSGAAVAATTTPAVVTAGKTFRVTRLAATYIATATSGYGVVRLRFNTGGVVVIGSPVAATLAVGAGTPATANSAGMEEAILHEGWEFAAGTGVGISVQGFAAATATAVGYVMVSMTGYEY